MDWEAARDVLRSEIAKHWGERTEEVPKDFMEDERTDKVPYHMATWKLPGAIPYQDFMEGEGTEEVPEALMEDRKTDKVPENPKPAVALYKARPLNKSQRAPAKHEHERVKQEKVPVKHEHEPVKQEKVPACEA